MSTDPSAPGAQSALTVLIVDDHPVVREGYRRLLESLGNIKVLAEADSGESGYEAYKQIRPEVVIMDLSMPGAGGLDAIKRITQWDPHAHILVLSMHENAVYRRRATEAGAIGYLSKACAPREMLDAVHSVAAGLTYSGGETEEDAKTATPQPIDVLTLREFEVFNLLALGHPVHDVARILNISHNTAGVHQTRIMNKLHLQNSAQLARLAILHGVVNV